ncbi:EAL domain-containing protein [Carnobacterium divergens]|uniref:EAL domain-containing protein n=1 Tax=Carnobacterium divergens TaxID=2748 RepID=A0AAW8R5X7_CARDV|nr:EAL domain-containing protein [Carnobacterium divergens]MDT1957109.1 EAL domain-containing protein [Carnobacterium divergens]MDT1973079.1 EAL domain-containing protein [Carnobacterium divergens]
MDKLDWAFYSQPIVAECKEVLIREELLLREETANCAFFPQKYWESLTKKEYQELHYSIIHQVKTILKKNLTNHYSINLSRNSLISTALITEIKKEWLSFKDRLVIEITEEAPIGSLTIHEQQQVELRLRNHMEELNKLGFTLSLDDIGTGVHSLENVLNMLPYVSELKYSLNNFQKINTLIDLEEFLQAWQHLAQSQGLVFIVEGIETKLEDEWLTKLGIKYKQGFYYGKPQHLQMEGD